MVEVNKKETESKARLVSPNQPVKKGKVIKENKILWIIFISVLVFNFLSVFFLFKSSSDLSGQEQLLVLEENLNKEGFDKNYFNEAKVMNNAFLNEKQTIDFLARINGMSSSFDSLTLKFEASEPVSLTGQKGLPFVLEVLGTPKATSSLLKDLLGSSCQFKVNNLLFESKDSFLNSANFLLKAELLVADEY